MKSQDLITDSLPIERSPTERIKEIQNLCGKHDPGHQGELLGKKDIKLINGLMVQVFFGKTQMNGVLEKKFHRLTAIMILKSKKWQLSIWLAKNKIFCLFWSREFQFGSKWKECLH